MLLMDLFIVDKPFIILNDILNDFHVVCLNLFSNKYYVYNVKGSKKFSR